MVAGEFHWPGHRRGVGKRAPGPPEQALAQGFVRWGDLKASAEKKILNCV